MPTPPPHIVIAGAGSIGCYTGGLLAAAGHRVTLLARPHVIAGINENGLSLSDFSGLSQHVSVDRLNPSDNPDCLARADLILITVKTGATAEMAGLIARHAAPNAPIVSLQNGLEAIATLRAALQGRDVRAAMVPFNVVPKGPGRYHRASSGDIVIGAGPGDLDRLLCMPGLKIAQSADITALQWGKLLINLNNALNALSGLTLRDMLMARDWRALMARQMAEALGVLRAADIAVKSTTPLSAALLPSVLRLPTPLFSRIAARMLTIDPSARSSMAYDLMRGNTTEIDSLQGAIIALGQTHGIATPICARVAQAIRHAGAKGSGPQGLQGVQGVQQLNPADI